MCYIYAHYACEVFNRQFSNVCFPFENDFGSRGHLSSCSLACRHFIRLSEIVSPANQITFSSAHIDTKPSRKINFPFRDLQMSSAHIRSTYVSQRAMEMIVSVQFSFCDLRTCDSNAGGLFSVPLPIPWQLMHLISDLFRKIKFPLMVILLGGPRQAGIPWYFSFSTIILHFIIVL